MRGQTVRRIIGITLIAAGGIAMSVPARATAGLLLTSVGAKEKGMGGAGMALPQDAVAAIDNPAAAAVVGDQITLGGTALYSEPSMRVRGTGAGPFPLAEGEADGKERSFLVPYLSATRRLDEHWSAGFAAYGLFGLGVSFPATPRPGCPPPLPGTGPLCAGKTTIDTSALFVSPTLAYRVTPQFSVGLSPALVYSKFKASGLGALAAFGASSDPADLTNRGSDEAFGFAAKMGMHYQGERLNLGLAYQTKAEMARYDGYRGLLPEGANVDLPAILSAGVAFRALPELTLLADLQYVFYSDVPALANPFVNPLIPGNPALGTDDAAGFGWKDQFVLHLGTQYQVSDTLALRAGYSYASRQFGASEALLNSLAPAVLRHTLTGGFSVGLGGGLTLDAALSWTVPQDQDGTNALSPGQALSSRHEITELGLGLSCAW